jgi:hypothetical protein
MKSQIDRIVFAFVKEEIEEALGQRWNRLKAGLTQLGDVCANFHPLTKHFFLKAFRDDGADEVVALIIRISGNFWTRVSSSLATVR